MTSKIAEAGPPPSSAATGPDEPVANDPSLRRTLQLVGTVVAPTTFITSLLFYFGWVRTAAQASRMGLDTTILGYSTQDYVLRSIRSMFVPLTVGLLLVVAGLWVHTGVSGEVARRRTADEPRGLRPLRRAAWAAVGAGLACAAVGLYDQVVPDLPTNLRGPLCFSAAVVLLSYAIFLLRGPLARPAETDRRTERWVGAARTTIVGLLLALSLFWSVSDYAKTVGRRLGDRILSGQAGLPSVVVYSPRRLYLDFNGVTETALDGTDGAYRFRYEGLQFLERTGGRYFLRPATAEPTQRVTIVLLEADAPQLQFVSSS